MVENVDKGNREGVCSCEKKIHCFGERVERWEGRFR